MRNRILGFAAFAGILLAVPAVFTRVPFYTMSAAIFIALFGLAALGLVPLTGRAGQVSMGQAAFYGIGAYTSALLTTKYHMGVLFSVLAGVALGALVAWLVGLFIFRTQGHYLALATLAFGLALGFLLNQLEVTGGNGGINSLPPMRPFGLDLSDNVTMWYFIAGILFLAVLAVDALLRSDIGRALTALGDSPIATAASGISISALRRWAFTLAGGLAGLAGALHAHWQLAVDPGMLHILNSVYLLIFATVGGLRTVWGPLLGAFAVTTLSEMSKLYIPLVLPNARGSYEIVVYGLALIVVLVFLPNGIAGGLTSLWRRLRTART
ncbi:branched-chain amino acid ABC transporter permease [Longispora fulva]|uniref:Branched-chain amino acid transport system permease protein n=1 Tax=Longispora fulva TaxID=619741 RepID=A0A8J7KT42_9ACTN|nr:branched-chain amino acid ABC transporter permease [Longispora fulva]MBG6140307.1 branched-chain amino acid transport system permease protein [Longispora fulva]GIG57313.1 branched-chain amino acid ABC transporter permease [Longispora fulva]